MLKVSYQQLSHYTKSNMQAGDRLLVIPTDEALETIQPLFQEKLRDAREMFLDLCRSLFSRFQNEMRAAAVKAEADGYSVVEISLKIRASDGSYLHVVVFSTKDQESQETFNVSMIEHSPDDVYLSGVLYGTEDDRIVRTVLGAPDIEGDSDDEVTFFSAIDYFESLSELTINPGLDQEDIDEINNVKKEILNDLENLQLDEEMGFNRIPVEIDELYQVAQLLMDVESFPLITEQCFTQSAFSGIITDEFPLTKRVSYLNVYNFTRVRKYDTERTC